MAPPQRDLQRTRRRVPQRRGAERENPVKWPSGNRCGHDPANPRLEPTGEVSPRIPLFLTDLLCDLGRYYDERLWIRTFPDLGEEGRRSEFREAAILVARVLVAHTDIVTKRVIAWKPNPDGSVYGITADTIAQETGMNVGRVQRVLDEFRWADLITSAQPCELKADGTYRGYPAIRTLTGRFFRRLRCNIKLDKAARAAVKHRKAAAEAAAAAQLPPAPGKGPMMIAKQARRAARRAGRSVGPVGGSEEKRQLTIQQAEQRTKRRLEVAMALRAKHRDDPAWTSERCYAEADRILASE